MNKSIVLDVSEKVSKVLNLGINTHTVLVVGWKWGIFPVFVSANVQPKEQEVSLLELANQETEYYQSAFNKSQSDLRATETERLTTANVLEQFEEKREQLYLYEKDSISLQKLINRVGSIAILEKIADSYISDSHISDSEKQEALATSDNENQCQCHIKPTKPDYSQ
jgi:hypothetical protein